MYRNNYSRGTSPRDRLDPRLLERLALRSELSSDLAEECMCGQTARNRSRSGYSSNMRNADNSKNGCGCGNNARSSEYEHEHKHDNSGCGCGQTVRNRTRCGCGNNTRAAEYENDNNGCGCGNNTRSSEYENDNSGCGCGRTTRNRTRCGCGNNARAAEYENDNNGCGCGNNTRSSEYENDADGCECENYEAEFDHTLAMVYSPMQQWQNLYCEEEGLMAGTIFRELDKPFYGAKCNGGNSYE